MTRLTATKDGWRGRDMVVRSLVLSLAIHLIAFGTWYYGNQHQFWQRDFFPSWLLPVAQTKKAVEEAIKRTQESPEMPLMFVEVQPEQATPDAPEKAPFYAAANSKAANAEVVVPSDVPNIDGQQTRIVKTEDVPRPKPQPLQPSPPTPKLAQPEERQEQPKLEPKPAKAPGDLAMINPATKPNDTAGEAEKKQEEVKPREKPRTIAEALARQGIQGERSKVEGGVKTRLEFSSVDAKATPFGAYDAALIAAVQSHWYQLIDQSGSFGGRSGKVVVEFRLLSSGRVVNLHIMEESVGGMLSVLCSSAIDGAAPFNPWPKDMRRMAGEFRDVTFTFYYN